MLFVLLATGLAAQAPQPIPRDGLPDPPRPLLTSITWDGDYGFLRDPARRTDRLDPLKYIPLREDGWMWLSAGGEYRIEHELVTNANWGAGLQDSNGYALQRVLGHVDARLGPAARVFAEVNFNLEAGRAGGPRPVVDRDSADVHQAFAELAGRTVTIRAGRQEMVFGSNRLIDNREGPNTKLSFDGARITARFGRWRADWIAVKPVETNPGAFDNSPDHRRSLWGVYMTRGTFDAYYLGFASARTHYDARVGPETRHTVGARVFRAPDKRGDFDWEAAYQTGSVACTPVRAWMLATDTGYTFAEVRGKPRTSLRFEAFSGNRASGRSFGTWNPLFPRGAVYGPRLTLLAPANLVRLQASVQARLRRYLTGAVDWACYWRQSLDEGVYDFGGPLLRSGGASRARYVGSQGNLQLRYAVSVHFTVTLHAGAFVPGPFVRSIPPAGIVTLLNLGLTYRF